MYIACCLRFVKPLRLVVIIVLQTTYYKEDSRVNSFDVTIAIASNFDNEFGLHNILRYHKGKLAESVSTHSNALIIMNYHLILPKKN